jgi:hypothetical protein
MAWFRKNYANLRTHIPEYEQEDYTPDSIWLETHQWVFLFLYDELQRSRSKYDMIKEDSVFMYTAFTEERDYVLWKKRLGEESFPIALRGADKLFTGSGITSRPIWKMPSGDIGPATLGRVKGEIHAIRPDRFWKALDKHYLNGVEFQRERVSVLIPYSVGGERFLKKRRAHMYVGIKDYWSKQLDGGLLFKTVNIYAPKTKWVDGTEMGMYYQYGRLEYETNF